MRRPLQRRACVTEPRAWGLRPPARLTASVRAFSLVELIGVLAVIAIMASMIVPALIKRLDRAAWTKEMSDLGAISNALTLQIVRSYNVPDQTTWAQSVANWVMWPASNITSNPRYFSRVYLIDPALSLSGAVGAGLPYTQIGNLGLTNRPANARVMVVSTIGRANGPATANFNETWNWNPALNPAGKPASWSSFPGTGDDVCIQRLNLEQLFYQLILVNRDPGSTNGSFAINATSASTAVTNGSIWNNYYLDGSVVRLYSTNVLATSYVLKHNMSFVYENGMWGGQIMDCLECTNPPPVTTTTNLADLFSAVASNFLNSAWNTTAAKAASQGTVLSTLANFMLDYPMLANTAPPFTVIVQSAAPGQQQNTIYNLLTAEQSIIDQYSGAGSGSGNGGLLYNK